MWSPSGWPQTTGLTWWPTEPSSWIGILVVPLTSFGSWTRIPDASLLFMGHRLSRHLAYAGPSVSERIEDRSFLSTYD